MIEFAKRLLWDEAAFSRYFRAVMTAAGAVLALNGGKLPDTKEAWIGLVVLFLGQLSSGGGEKNLPAAEEKKDAPQS